MPAGRGGKRASYSRRSDWRSLQLRVQCAAPGGATRGRPAAQGSRPTSHHTPLTPTSHVYIVNNSLVRGGHGMRNVCFFSGIALYAATVAHGQTTGALAVSTAQRTFLDQHCIACHNDKVKSGGMSLARLSPELGEKVIRKVRTGMMPPPGMPRATAADAQTFV